ncbi:MAG: hypothetical protein LAO07_20795, partial [Acidobacteriia bacterium]|nr:hypothetical protein [Terriglobia bacterium]
MGRKQADPPDAGAVGGASRDGHRALMQPAVGFVLACAAIATTFQVAPVVLGWRFFRRARRRAAAWSNGPLPPVTLLKPLKGQGIDLLTSGNH